MKKKKYSKRLCMFSLNYQILDTSRANDILLPKRGKKEKKNKPNSIKGCFSFLNIFHGFFCKIILSSKSTETDFDLLMDVGLV